MPILSRSLPLGNRLPWFSVTDLEGRLWTPQLLPADRVTLVAFLCAHSPYVMHIERHLGEVTRELMGRGVTVLAIGSNDARAYPSDGPERLRDQTRRCGFAFPYGYDDTQQVAKAFGASCTPEFFLYNAGGRLVYHGEYDDSRPGDHTPVSGQAVRTAVDATLAGDFVGGDQYRSLGCSIKWRAGNEPSYSLA